MKLNESQMEQLRAYLAEHFKNVCGVCDSGNWQFDDVLFEIRQFMGEERASAGLIKPAVAITCGTCGNIVLINALAAGVLSVGDGQNTDRE
jgi:hypothetical protein